MLQLDILSGKKAGTQWVARRFPFRLGRSSQAELALDDHGVWDHHAEFSLMAGEGVVISAAPQAFVAVNGQKAQQARLRNGDIIEAGSVKLRFSLSATTQSGLRFRETVTWLSLAALCLGQVVLIYWLTG